MTLLVIALNAKDLHSIVTEAKWKKQIKHKEELMTTAITMSLRIDIKDIEAVNSSCPLE